MPEVTATVENMRRMVRPGRPVFAYSYQTGERYSATPGDYFWLPDDEPIVDSMGEPMVLATEYCVIESA